MAFDYALKCSVYVRYLSSKYGECLTSIDVDNEISSSSDLLNDIYEYYENLSDVVPGSVRVDFCYSKLCPECDYKTLF